MHELMMSPAGRTALRSVLILAVFLVSWNAARVVGKRLEQRRNSLHVRFAVSCAKGLIAIAAVAAFCMQFSMTREFALTLFQSASLMVAVIGFAAQAVLADVIAGMVLSLAKPFDTGERVVLEDMGIAGIVETITMRHTVIRAYDGSRILVPNSVVNKQVLRNSNFDGNVVGTFLEVAVSYESDLERAIEIVKKAVLAEPAVVDKSKGNGEKEISVLLSAMNDSGCTVKTTIWTETVDESFRVASNIRLRIIRDFSGAGIEIPYPHVTVRS